VVASAADTSDSWWMTSDLVARDATVADGLRLVEKRYPAGLWMPRHSHAEWRYCLTVRGAHTDSWRRGFRTRTRRQLSLHPPEEMHTSVFHTDAVCLHVELLGRWQERLRADADISAEPHEFLEGQVPLVATQLYEEFGRRDACSNLVLEGLACELIGWSARSLRGDGTGASWVYRARDLVRARFTESLTLDDIARSVGVHPVHLARQFRNTFGCTVGEFVRRTRIDFVCTQLPTKAPLSDIALRAGFSDQSHLTRVFKRATGLTPRQYRIRR
jgi:AraC family transcriptional regulator